MVVPRLAPKIILELGKNPDFFEQAARRMILHLHSPRNRRKVERWTLVAEATCHGSTYSQAICEYFGLNPHERV